MEFYNADVTCRPQYKMKIENVTDSQGNLDEMCCCHYEKTLPEPRDMPTVFASICYFAEITNKLSRWSVMRYGRDLMCTDEQYMVNTTYFVNGTDQVYSCCQPKEKDVPTTLAPNPDETTPDRKRKSLNFLQI